MSNPIILIAIAASILGYIAYKKNRNYLAWATVGALFFLPALLLLAVNNPLCPECHKEVAIKARREGKCAKCGETLHFRYSGKIIEHRGAIVMAALILLIICLYVIAKATNFRGF